MKRLVIAAAVAGAVLVCAGGEARANGGYGFGFGVGVNFSFSGWTFNPCGGSCGSCSTCCCVIPGWSPEYAPPTMYGGLQALQSYGYSPSYGYPQGWGYHGGAAGALPPPNPDGKGVEKKPAGKEIEK